MSAGTAGAAGRTAAATDVIVPATSGFGGDAASEEGVAAAAVGVLARIVAVIEPELVGEAPVWVPAVVAARMAVALMPPVPATIFSHAPKLPPAPDDASPGAGPPEDIGGPATALRAETMSESIVTGS
jgi:hypothetical protein